GTSRLARPRGGRPPGTETGVPLTPPPPFDRATETEPRALKLMAASAKASPLKFPRVRSVGIPPRAVQTDAPKALLPFAPVPRLVHNWLVPSQTTARSDRRSPEMSPVAIETGPVQPVRSEERRVGERRT